MTSNAVGRECNRHEGAMLDFVHPPLIPRSSTSLVHVCGNKQLMMSCTWRVHESLKLLNKKQTAPAAILEGLGFDIQPCTVICVSTSLGKSECDWLKGQFSGHIGGLLGKELGKHVSLSVYA